MNNHKSTYNKIDDDKPKVKSPLKKLKKLRLNIFHNCFNTDKNHLGFKLGGILYCITHSPSSQAVIVNNEEISMKIKSTKNKYLKVALNQQAEFINKTNMFIDYRFVIENLYKLKLKL